MGSWVEITENVSLKLSKNLLIENNIHIIGDVNSI